MEKVENAWQLQIASYLNLMLRYWYFQMQPPSWHSAPLLQPGTSSLGGQSSVRARVKFFVPSLWRLVKKQPFCIAPLSAVSEPLGGSAVRARVHIKDGGGDTHYFWGDVTNLGMICSSLILWGPPRCPKEGRKRTSWKMLQLWRSLIIAAFPSICAKTYSQKERRHKVQSQRRHAGLMPAVPALPANLHLQHLSCRATRETKQPLTDSPETEKARATAPPLPSALHPCSSHPVEKKWTQRGHILNDSEFAHVLS